MSMRKVLSLALALLAVCLQAAAGDIAFRPLPSQSLPSENVLYLYQDGEGYLWAVTYQGIVRYDGYDTRLYFTRSAADDYFDNYLHSVIDYDEKSLLVATARGLFLMDKHSGSVERVEDEALSNVNISRMTRDSNGKIWISSDKGVFCRGKDESRFTWVGLSDAISVCSDWQGDIWITTWMSGLHRYSTSEGKLYSYNQGALGSAFTLFLDSKGRLWVGTWGNGLLKTDPASATDDTLPYQRFSHDDRQPDTILDNIIYDISEDEEGNIWIGSRSGLSIMREGKFVNYYPDGTDEGLPYNEVNSIVKTADGTMMLGLLGGGICIAESDQSSYSTIKLESIRAKYKTNSVKNICYTGDGIYWLGISGHGLSLYDANTGRESNYSDLPAFRGFPSTGIVETSLELEDSGQILFGSYESGLWVYDYKDKTGRVFSSANSGLGDNRIRALAMDSRGDVIIGTSRGVYRMSRDGDIRSIDPELKIIDLAVDSSDCIWAATDFSGIVKFSPEGKTGYLSGNERERRSFNSVLVDSSSNIWVASPREGLYLYDRNSDSFKALEELAFLGRRNINNLAQSPDGRIWITADNQLASFLYSDGSFESVWFESLDGVSFNMNTSAYLPDSGRMAFGSTRGIVCFPCTQSPSPKGYESRASITDIEQNQRDVTVSFSLMDFSPHKNGIYRYRLSRKSDRRRSEGWTIISAESNKASFRNLKPGRYIFEVSGSRFGDKTPGAVSSLEIYIPQNPWLSWWAFMIYAILLFAAVFFPVRITRERIEMKRRIAYEQFRAQKTEEINQAKLSFFTNVSHEFLTPLSIILASIESLDPKTQKDKNVTAIMSSNAIRLTRLVQQVLDFRKVESDNMRLKVSEGDAAEFIGHCVEAFKPLVRKRNLTITYTCDPTSIKGWFDPDKLDKIIYNLISNAVKYTPENGTISVEARLASDSLIVNCTNGGKVMSKSTISKLFQRFYEGDYRKFNTIGNGIGLSLVKDLVTIHKGTIKVESAESIGNRFSFTIPISQSSYSEAETDQENPKNSSLPLALTIGEDVIKENYTVLCVDDSQDLCDLFNVILSKRFNVITCGSAEEAIEILSGNPVDVVVTDVMMPGMNGMDLCSYIKEHIEYSHIPVILLTAKKDDDSSIEGYRHGADGYLTKPCNFAVLSAMISNLMRKREKQIADLRTQLVFEVKDGEYTSIDKQFLEKAVGVVGDHISDESFSQSDFAAEMAVSKTVLTEKMKSLTGFTPVAFIINTRLAVAYKTILKETGKIRVSDLAYSVGFADAKYFSKSFKAKFGKSPKELIDEVKERR